MRDPEQTPSARAERLGEALRAAREILAGVDDGSDATEPGAVLTALRSLINGIDAIRPKLAPGEIDSFTVDEKDFVVSAAVPMGELTGLARREAEDWALWWALRNHAVHLRLDALTSHSGHMIIPELHRVIDAFPPAYDELDIYRILRRPMVELDGLSPMRWLILGRPVEMVIALIRRETRPQPPPLAVPEHGGAISHGETVARLAGSVSGTYSPEYLQDLREGWKEGSGRPPFRVHPEEDHRADEP